ncbi:arsenic resistance protein [Alkalihalobacillus pseudalcaliphilus]|uniref:arsenic resistance protein n=1 Tax=Alkalihalobacillus pseudalcaliphilus TaxID=79884 RepID=UPI00064DE433|nr:bile acid:sodium symporter [Alkalihalobacillus pseudalcaliphilus]KMK75332.1 arsenic resistance protein [Alkalihalobacillus pseudalcaliphilus]
MNNIEKFQTCVILIAVVIGLLLGQVTLISDLAASLILPCLLLMLYGLFLAVPFPHIRQAVEHKRFIGANILINFVWTPMIAFAIGSLFLSDHPALWLGFILLLITPCTDWYLIFTSMAKGNIKLSTAVLPINLLLQMVLLPIYLLLLGGVFKLGSLYTMLESTILVLLVPFLLAWLTRRIFRHNSLVIKSMIPLFSQAQILFLALAIMAMFASQGHHLLENLEVIYLLLLPLLLFFIINFATAHVVSKLANFSTSTNVSLSLLSIARNSPIVLAIVITAFPEQPLIALALIIGPLIELPILALATQILIKTEKRRAH